MSYIHQEYPKWINTIDNKQIVVNNEIEELKYKGKEDESAKNNSKGLDKKIINANRSTGTRGKSKLD